jgi:hypothetical protein
LLISQEWNGGFFVPATLKKLGLRIQLGHPNGTRCLVPERAKDDDFVVIDIHGVHQVGLDFCGCQTGEEHVTQLLRNRWFPATSKNPKTAATFSVLDLFQVLSFESKASVYEMWNTILRRTDNTDINTNVVSRALLAWIKST